MSDLAGDSDDGIGALVESLDALNIVSDPQVNKVSAPAKGRKKRSKRQASQTLSIVNQYRCPAEALPSNLYRVHYPESRTTYTTENGLEAAGTTTFYDDVDLFKKAAENHFTWGYRGRSPFISLFSEQNHAQRWGWREPWHGGKDKERWQILTIDTDLLDKVYVFKLSTLVDALGVAIPKEAGQHKHGAYICLHKVPPGAIVQKKPASQAKADSDQSPRSRTATFEE